MLFCDRADAGRQLLSKLGAYQGRPDVVVLGLPRGGIPVAYEVARGLGAPLDVFVVRKLGVPGQEELAMGAIATGGVRVVNRDVVDALHIPPDVLDRAAAEELRELERREQSYRGERPQPRVEGRTVILVDDGLATGSTMRAAVAALRQQGPARIVVAVPVAAPSTCADLRREVEEVVCFATPEPFLAVGRFYDDFSQTTDEEVTALLASARDGEEEVRIAVDGVTLVGDLALPVRPQGVILFAHGSGSSRHSSRNRYVAGELRRVGMGTLLMDLLTAEEEEADARTGHLRFDIDLLARRLLAATGWLRAEADTARLPVGYFGASTGGGAALVAAAEEPEAVRAVVSRGGRPDLAGDALPRVESPTLLIVGGRDEPVIAMNEEALARLRCEKRLEIVPGATHLFEEPGTLEQVARLAADWLGRHLTRAVPEV
jgi:putative phosphoribosyl transferase